MNWLILQKMDSLWELVGHFLKKEGKKTAERNRRDKFKPNSLLNQGIVKFWKEQRARGPRFQVSKASMAIWSA